MMSLPVIEVLWQHTTRRKKLITRQFDAAVAYDRFSPSWAHGPAFLVRWRRNAATGVSGGGFRPVKFVTAFLRKAVPMVCFIKSVEFNRLTVPL
jgi:hypothetical protein